MSKGYLSFATHKKEAEKLAKLSGFNTNQFEYYEKTPPLRTAMRVLRLFSADIYAFFNDICTTQLVTGSYDIERSKLLKCPIMWTKDKGEYDQVIVFPNLTLDMWSKGCADVISPWMYAVEMLGKLAQQIKDDCSGSSARWQHNGLWARGRARILKREKMSLTKALTNYTYLKQKYSFQDHNIAKMATEMASKRMPITVHYATTREQYTEMYHNGPESCMMTNKKGKPEIWCEMERAGVVPAQIYAWHPRAKGAYLKTADGKIRARVICWHGDDDKWYYGRLYDIGDSSGDILAKALKKEGFKNISKCDDGTYRARNLVEFDVEGTFLSSINQYIMPFPYFDNATGKFRVTFDKDSKVFHVKHQHDLKDHNGIVGTAQGYLCEADLQKIHCHHCASHIKPGGTRFHHLANNHFYCSDRCFRERGLVMAYRNDGTATLALKTECVQDLLQDRYWTTVAAAKACGAKVVDGMYDSYEEPRLSVYVSQVKDTKGEVHNISAALLDRLQRDGKVKETRGEWRCSLKQEQVWPFEGKITLGKQTSITIDLTELRAKIIGRMPEYVRPIQQDTPLDFYSMSKVKRAVVTKDFQPSALEFLNA